MNNQDYDLEKNAGTCCLHGGSNGFAHKIWKLVAHRDNELILELKSDHLDQNFPGSLLVTAKFSLLKDALIIHYSARLDDTNSPSLSTIVNLTNHAYFNLDGCEPADCQSTAEQDITVLSHEVYSKDAKAILEQDSNQVSTGRLIKLEDADPLFQIDKGFISLREGCEKGLYDHSFAFETDPSKYTVLANPDEFEFEAISKKSNIKLTVRTDNFSCHMYTGPRTSILSYPPLSGVCFEAQAFPNACNIPDWSNQCIVTKDRPYSKFISFAFSSLN